MQATYFASHFVLFSPLLFTRVCYAHRERGAQETDFDTKEVITINIWEFALFIKKLIKQSLGQNALG